MAPTIKCGDGFHYYVNGDPVDSCLCRYFKAGARGFAIHNGIAAMLPADVDYGDVVRSESTRLRVRMVRIFARRFERATAFAVQRAAERDRLELQAWEFRRARSVMQRQRQARRMYAKENRASTAQTSLHGGVVRGAWRAVLDEHVRPWEWEPDAVCT